jgi:hypothetical protein
MAKWKEIPTTPSPVAVKVKPLVWKFGQASAYAYLPPFSSGCFLLLPGGGQEGPSIDAVFSDEAAARADYEARILSTLEATPSPEAIVRAALERAVTCCEDELRNTAMLMSNPPKSSAAWDAANSIRKLASDPAEVAAIIKAAGEDRG